MNRNISLDITRTLAIVLMVIFHFIYDLKFFGFIETDIPDGDGWRHFRWLIITLFFICLGISLSFAHAKKIRFKKFTTRFLQIAICAFIISIATYFAIPANWIFFGVLHFLALASVLVLPFVNKPKLCLLIGLCFFALAAAQIVPSRWPFHLLFNDLPQYTNDYVAIVPWLGMVFLGVSVAHTKWLKNDPLARYFKMPANKGSNSPLLTRLVWPGQHSLSIYVLHQPIMMGGLYVFKEFIL